MYLISVSNLHTYFIPHLYSIAYRKDLRKET